MLIKIAIPVAQGRLLGHFGEARHFALVEADLINHGAFKTQVFDAPAHEPGSFPYWLREQNIQILIISHKGIGQRALDNLRFNGVEVREAKSGAPISEIVVAYLEGGLPMTCRACDRQRKSDFQFLGFKATEECRFQFNRPARHLP